MKASEWIKYLVLIGGLFCMSSCLALLMSGCMNKYAQSIKYYESGAIAEISYSQDTSVKFWSEGNGKTIEISPSVVGGF